MSRLTTTSDKGGLAFTFDLDVTCEISEMKKIAKLGEKLKHYEDLEEQGLLLKLPCKVGDTVYALSFSRDEGRWFECVVKTININSEENYAVAHCEELDLGVTLFFDRFGETVFLTKEEAEQTLERMKEGEW